MDGDVKGDVDLTKVLAKLKAVPNKYWIWGALAVILLFGLHLRSYHLDYPVMGYHNWKTAHYITEARNFAEDGFFENGFFVPARDTTSGILEHESGAHADTFPMASILVAIGFKIFGPSLVVARSVMILFSLLGVLAMFLLVKELFQRDDLALVSALIVAINPLSAFFTHNVQLVNVGMPLMLLSAYWYVKWHKSNLAKHLYLWVGFLTLATMTKYPFAIIAIPILLTFPYKRVLGSLKTKIKEYGIAVLLFLPLPLWFLYAEKYLRPKFVGSSSSDHFSGIVDFSIFSSAEFKAIMKSFIADNFTSLGLTLAIIGFLILTAFLLVKKRSLGNKFVFWYALSIFPFLVIMGFKLSGHNYHQFYIAPIIMFFIAYFVVFIGTNIAQFLRSVKGLKKYALHLRWVIFILLIFFIPLSAGKTLYDHSLESRDRMFNTQFPGLDVAGKYINAHSESNEAVIHSSGQSHGFLWHADRQGYKNPATKELFQELEDERGVGWVFIYQWGFEGFFRKAEQWQYIQDNYELRQAAFIQGGNGVRPLYYLLKRGGTFNASQPLDVYIRDKPVQTRVYEYTSGTYQIGYINV